MFEFDCSLFRSCSLFGIYSVRRDAVSRPEARLAVSDLENGNTSDYMNRTVLSLSLSFSFSLPTSVQAFIEKGENS